MTRDGAIFSRRASPESLIRDALWDTVKKIAATALAQVLDAIDRQPELS